MAEAGLGDGSVQPGWSLGDGLWSGTANRLPTARRRKYRAKKPERVEEVRDSDPMDEGVD